MYIYIYIYIYIIYYIYLFFVPGRTLSLTLRCMQFVVLNIFHFFLYIIFIEKICNGN